MGSSDEAPVPEFSADRAALRALRAERLARLRPAGQRAPDAAALAAFLESLAGQAVPALAAAPPGAPGAEVLTFPRPVAVAAAPDWDLHCLTGVGPGLAWALTRAGLGRRADLAALEPADLAARLGPIGRLVPAAAWIAAARAGG